MTHFKRPKSSTGCGQCREALGKGPTASGGSGMHQEGSLFWGNCAWAGNFLGRSYCLQVANMLMFPLTANFLAPWRPHSSIYTSLTHILYLGWFLIQYMTNIMLTCVRHKSRSHETFNTSFRFTLPSSAGVRKDRILDHDTGSH